MRALNPFIGYLELVGHALLLLFCLIKPTLDGGITVVSLLLECIGGLGQNFRKKIFSQIAHLQLLVLFY